MAPGDIQAAAEESAEERKAGIVKPLSPKTAPINKDMNIGEQTVFSVIFPDLPGISQATPNVWTKTTMGSVKIR